ncbi:unnamed protein product [Amoebophrya sp. A25]|nr:unnamed protein product [Amoebophrya sp. A25]|eukprot:GSA25T00015829001.1
MSSYGEVLKRDANALQVLQECGWTVLIFVKPFQEPGESYVDVLENKCEEFDHARYVLEQMTDEELNRDYQQERHGQMNLLQYLREKPCAVLAIIASLPRFTRLLDPHPERHQSCLSDACRLGQKDAVEALFGNKHTPDELISCPNEHRATYLHQACYNGHLNIVEYVLTHPRFPQGLDLWVRGNTHNATCMHLACCRPQIEVAKFLVTHPKCPKELINWGNKHSATCLHLACEDAHIQVVEFLVSAQKCREERLILQQNKNGFTCLHLAIQKGHIEVVKALLNNSDALTVAALIPLQTKNGNTCFHITCQEGFVPIMEFLWFHSDVPKEDMVGAQDKDGYNCLNDACYYGHLQLIEFFFNHWPQEDVAARYRSTHHRPLAPRMKAVATGGGHHDASARSSGGDKEKDASDLNNQSAGGPDSPSVDATNTDDNRDWEDDISLVSQDDRFPSLTDLIFSVSGGIGNCLHVACSRGHLSIVEFLCTRKNGGSGGLGGVGDITGGEHLQREGDSPASAAAEVSAMNGDHSGGQSSSSREPAAASSSASPSGQHQSGLLPLGTGASQHGHSSSSSTVRGGARGEAASPRAGPPNNTNVGGNAGGTTGAAAPASPGAGAATDRYPPNGPERGGPSLGTADHAEHQGSPSSFNEMSDEESSEVGPEQFYSIEQLVLSKNKHNASGLHLASIKGHLEIAKFLVDNTGLSPEKKRDFLGLQNKKGATCLHFACYHGNVEVVKFLVNHPNCPKELIQARNRNHYTCLHSACDEGRFDVIEFLCSNANFPIELLAAQARSNTILHKVCEYGYLNIVKLLVQQSIAASERGVVSENDPSFKPDTLVTFRNNLGDTCLHVAAAEGHLLIVEYLVKCAAAEKYNLLFTKNKQDMTCLQLACSEGHLSVVEFLLNFCTVNDPSQKRKDLLTQSLNVYHATCLFSACEAGHTQIVECLLEHKHFPAQLIHAQTKYGTSCLHAACEKGFMDIVQLLMNHKHCNKRLIQCKDRGGQTCLELAKCEGHAEIVEYVQNHSLWSKEEELPVGPEQGPSVVNAVATTIKRWFGREEPRSPQ